MKVARILLLLFVLCLYCSAVGASDVFEATPTEQSDTNPIDEGNRNTSEVFESTPAEQDDMKTIDEINKGSSDVFEADPIEQNDMKTIDQLNN